MHRNSTRQNTKPGHKLKVESETKKSSKFIDPYACAIEIKHQFLDTWLIVGHIPREISLHCYFFMAEGDNITGHMTSTIYKVSPTPAGGLEVLLLLTFSVKSERMLKSMKSFVNDLHNYDYTVQKTENNEKDSGDDEGINVELTGE